MRPHKRHINCPLPLRLGAVLALFTPAFAVAFETAHLADIAPVALFSAPAQVLTQTLATLSAEVGARVIELPYRAGESIEAGEVVAKLDCQKYHIALRQRRAEIKQLQAQLAFAQEQLQRAQTLSSNISREIEQQRQTTLITTEAQLAANQAALEQTQLDIDNCQIRTPYDATLIEQLVSVGEFVALGQGVIRLQQRQFDEVEAQIPPQQLKSLQQSRQIEFISHDTHYPVALRAALPVVTPQQHSRPVRLSFIAKAALSGSHGRLQWQGESRLLPPRYLAHYQTQTGLFILNAERIVEFIALPTPLLGRAVSVELAADTLIIIGDTDTLQPGPLK